jgi:hypothetical protein
MSSLFDNLTSGVEKKIEKTSSEIPGFSIKLSAYKDAIVNEYNKFGIDLNQGIAKIAKTNAFNDEQIQRVVEEVNNEVYLLKYANLKRFPEREVVFDLASTPEIKSIIGGKQPESDTRIQKKASLENTDGDDGMNFLNFTSHETAGLGTPMKDMREILAEKVANDLSGVSSEFEKALNEYNDGVYTIVETLVQYDRHHKDAQVAFNRVCKEASIDKKHQCIVKKAMDQKIGQMIEQKIIPPNYSLDLSLVDISEENPYSLGGYSLMKEARESNAQFPAIKTDSGKLIKNINDLIATAKKMESDKTKLLGISSKKQQMLDAMKRRS